MDTGPIIYGISCKSLGKRGYFIYIKIQIQFKVSLEEVDLHISFNQAVR